MDDLPPGTLTVHGPQFIPAVPAGSRFGQWTALSEVEKRGRTRHVLCRCACGTERVVALGGLRNGQSQSCGKCSRKGALKIADGVKFDGHLFGDILADLLKIRGWSRMELARRLKKTPNYVYNLIYGMSNPVPGAIDRIAAAIESNEREAYRLHLAAARDRGYRI